MKFEIFPETCEPDMFDDKDYKILTDKTKVLPIKVEISTCINVFIFTSKTDFGHFDYFYEHVRIKLN